MTSEERITSLHMRMGALKETREKQEQHKLAALGTGCCVLAACLVLLICSAGRGGSGGTAGLYSGATILFENAGGYVAIAVAAFMIGVIITAALLKKRFKSESGEQQANSKNKAEEEAR